MGQPMARNLLKAGFELRVYNRNPSRAQPLLAQGVAYRFSLRFPGIQPISLNDILSQCIPCPVAHPHHS